MDAIFAAVCCGAGRAECLRHRQSVREFGALWIDKLSACLTLDLCRGALVAKQRPSPKPSGNSKTLGAPITLPRAKAALKPSPTREGYSQPAARLSSEFHRSGCDFGLFCGEIDLRSKWYRGTDSERDLAQFNGENENTPAGIGSLITASSYYAAVLSVLVGTGATLGVHLRRMTASPTGFEAQIGIDQEPTLSAGNITVGT